MIKKAFVFNSIIFFAILNIFSENYYLDTSNFVNKPESEWLTIRILTNDHYGILKGYKKNGRINSELRIEREFTNINLTVSNHFFRDKNSSFNRGKERIQYFIPGKGILMECIVRPSDAVPIWIPYEMRKDINDITSYDYYTWKKFKEESQNFEEMDARDTVKNFDTGIKLINASSYLTENTKKGIIKYLPENILEKVFYKPMHDYSFIQYDSLTPPWVEGKEDFGIGEYLDIEFKWPSDELQILNGFVDFTRMDLYEKNSRVKTVLIESQNPKFSKEYELEDLVKYTVINLPEKTDKIRITIKDVYPGTKYKDTCLSSILVTNPNTVDFYEMTEMIIAALREGCNHSGPTEASELKTFINDISTK